MDERAIVLLEKMYAEFVKFKEDVTDRFDKNSIMLEKIQSEVRRINANQKYSNELTDNLKYSLETLARQTEVIKSDIKVGQEVFAAELGKQKFDIEKMKKTIL